jgi:MYXO-CTERM domain-containing protein
MNFTLQGTGGDPDPGLKSVSLSGAARAALEITTPALNPFSATRPATSTAQTVTIANRLGSTLRLCMVDETSFSAPSDFDLVGRTYDAGPGRCATLSSPGTVVNQDITFTPTADVPRLARFTAQRVSGGALVGPEESIALQGNVGPFMSISGAGLTNNNLFTGVRQDINGGAATPSVIALSNAGNQTLRVSSVSIPLVTGAGGAEYSASGCAVGTQLAPGALCNLSVSFDPIDVGTRATTLLIGYSDAANTPASRRTVSIDLRGQGTRGASLVARNAGGVEIANGSTEAFGQQNINIAYKRQITLHNIGTDEALTVSARSIAPTSSGFDLVAPAVAGACPTIGSGFTLAAEASCVAELTFSPTAVAPYSGTLTLPSRPAGAVTAPVNFVLNLTGVGVDGRPALAWQTAGGAPLSLLEVPGITAVGSATPPQVSLRLANPGPGAAALQLLNVIGTGASSFAIGTTAPGRCDFGNAAAPLLEGASCEVVITFQPQTAGAKTSNLQLVSTGTTPAPLEIRGQASGPAVTIALMATPPSMNLNQVRVGAQSAPAAITLSNNGTLATVVTAIESSSGFVVEPGSCGALPFTLEPRASCALAVRFAPGSSGAANGILRVQVSGMAAAIEVALQGSGTEAADVSGGGCSISDGHSPADPTLWVLALLAAVALLARRRRRAARRNNGAQR